MRELLGRLRRDLRTTLVGADPALPVKAPRPIVSALGVLVIVSLGAMATQYLRENRDLALPVAAGVGTLTVLSLLAFRHRLAARRVSWIRAGRAGMTAGRGTRCRSSPPSSCSSS